MYFIYSAYLQHYSTNFVPHHIHLLPKVDTTPPSPELCYTLMTQKFPPVERAQAILGLVLRLLTSALETKGTVTCTVYPQIKWPGSCVTLALKMMDHIMNALTDNLLISDRSDSDRDERSKNN